LTRSPTTDETIKNINYEQRLTAEATISRPVMEGCKAMIKEEGVFGLPATGKLMLEE